MLKALVLHVAILPIQNPAAQAAGIDETEEPPSMVRLSSSAADALTLTSTRTIAVQTSTLQPITVGQSRIAAEQEAEQARIAAEQEAARKKAEEEALRAQQEAERKAQAAREAQKRVTVVVIPETGSFREKLQSAAIARFGESEWAPLEKLLMRESGINPNAVNKRSGACGAFQALPCSKMGGMAWDNQINWGLNYIANRYGTPSKAWAHSQRIGWY